MATSSSDASDTVSAEGQAKPTSPRRARVTTVPASTRTAVHPPSPYTGVRASPSLPRVSEAAPTIHPAAPSAGVAPILVAHGVTKVYRSGAETVTALKSVDLKVPRGQFVSVMGPSGSGKTTLLNCLSGLDDIDAGSITVDGSDITKMSDAARTRHRAASMGFIFQAFNLIPVFNAVENVELPLLLAGRPAKEARTAAAATLDRVGLGHRLTHRPPELSGGEQQRVAVARALAGSPAIVWADEPTGNLDSETAGAVMGLLRELHAAGLTVLLVTHDEAIGATAQRRVVVRDGVIVGDDLL